EANILIGDYYLQDRFIWKASEQEGSFGFRSLFFQYQSEWVGVRIGVLPSAFDNQLASTHVLWVPHFREELGFWSHIQEGFSLFWQNQGWKIVWQMARPIGYQVADWSLWTEGLFRYSTITGWQGSFGVQSGRAVVTSASVQQKLFNYGFGIPLDSEIKSRLAFLDLSYGRENFFFQLEYGILQWFYLSSDQDHFSWWRMHIQLPWVSQRMGPVIRYHYLRPEGDLKKGDLARWDWGLFFKSRKHLIHGEFFIRNSHYSLDVLPVIQPNELFLGVRWDFL
ncbi:MAG: hypothetical protein NZ480_03855, partial [Bdellovibrionaceae bacterium]|nr:hypothetical protein [Pseudobdellovibrionaceae bacterium]